jgi:phosphopantetheine adenylyltransferase
MDRNVTLSVAFALITAVATVAGVFSSFSARLEHVEQVTGLLSKEYASQQQVVVKVARIDERVAAMQEVLSEIKADLRRERK